MHPPGDEEPPHPYAASSSDVAMQTAETPSDWEVLESSVGSGMGTSSFPSVTYKIIPVFM
jgi:hypothetical protein